MTVDDNTPTEIRRAACPCGWKPPVNLSLVNAIPVGVMVLYFDCPECGRRMKKDAKGSRPAR